MPRTLKALSFLACFLNLHLSYAQLPTLQKKGQDTQLLVNSKPYLILGGEVGNSSASTMEAMQPIWTKLKAMHLNTVLVPVYWELVEKEEGKFDFTLVKQLIKKARKQDLKLVLLWFGAWKNSMSSHAPAWVKLDQERFPRVKDDQGRSHEILTPFSHNNLQADRQAFEKLMAFLKKEDRKHTVIMVQVENEIGMLPTARDYHPLANEAFAQPVPAQLMNYLQKHQENLVPELRQIWERNGLKTSGTWQEVFGTGTRTDEIFMAWHYATFTDQLAEAGKWQHPLPLFVNAALPRPNAEPGKGYPSAGPLPHLMDIWKAAAPSLDFLSPDFYNPDFQYWNDLYTRQGDPLFIPEHRFDNTVAAKALFAIGRYGALGFSPFSIESTDKPDQEPLGKMYGLLTQLTPIITANHGLGKIKAVLFDKVNQEQVVELGKYQFTFRHDYTLGWSPGAKEEDWPMTSALLIQTGVDEFYFTGAGVVVTVKPLQDSSLNVGILKVDEGRFDKGKWHVTRHLNGDQTHQGRHLRLPVGEYNTQRVELYLYR
ncbi:MAG: DUF5597 domain-containing protein [Rufibacter sp.]